MKWTRLQILMDSGSRAILLFGSAIDRKGSELLYNSTRRSIVDFGGGSPDFPKVDIHWYSNDIQENDDVWGKNYFARLDNGGKLAVDEAEPFLFGAESCIIATTFTSSLVSRPKGAGK
jgi:hypothetical protein